MTNETPEITQKQHISDTDQYTAKNMYKLASFVVFSMLALAMTIRHHDGDHHHDEMVTSTRNVTFPQSKRSATNGAIHTGNDKTEAEHHGKGIKLISWHFDYVRLPLIISTFLIVTAVCKLVFHMAEFLSSIIPESCLLICLGTMVGGTFYLLAGTKENFVNFSAQLFFLYLLPPIILDAAFSLHHRAFFDNIGSVLLYAVVGTILNWIMIGTGLYAMSVIGLMGTFDITLVHCFVFSSLIVAVDPVAVLAIFQDLGVNNVLYFLIFGESLLNDAVTVVLYNMMNLFNEMKHIPISQVLLGCVAFFTVSFGGLTIGLLFGIMSAILTRGTLHVQVVEPLTIFVFAYTSYLVAELFHFSGIISIIGCGLMQAQYSFHNISYKSCTTVKVFSKMMSSTSDSVIFLFLGLSLVQTERVWHSGFIFSAIGLCLLVRFIVVYFLTFIANRMMRLRPVNIEEQFIMAYGGVRGAVAFSLVAMLDKSTIHHQGLFETATLAVIIFTVFIQGITIKPLVRLLRIQRNSKKIVSIFEEINNHVTDHVMAGMEVIIGHYGTNYFREIADRVDTHYLQPYLLREPQTKDDQIMELYQKIALQVHLEMVAGPHAAEMFSLSYMDLYKLPVWSPKMGNIVRRKDILNLRRSTIPTRSATQRNLGRRLTTVINNHNVNRVPRDVWMQRATFLPSWFPQVSQSEDQAFRLNRLDSMHQHTSEPRLEEVKDVHRLLKNAAIVKINHQYNPQLTQDFADFLLHHLREKQIRNARVQHALRLYNTHHSNNTSDNSSIESVLSDRSNTDARVLHLSTRVVPPRVRRSQSETRRDVDRPPLTKDAADP